MKTTILNAVILTFLSFSIQSQPVETVKQVEIDKYLGRWYDIASYPAVFQKGCRCTTADYELAAGKRYIRVINRCIRFRNGRSTLATARGKAYIVKGSGNARLKVQFFWPFRGDYNIIGLAGDYSWALVGDSKRRYLWILSREPFMPSHTYQEILLIVREKGFDVNKLVKTPQNCDNEK